jgi:hypothetical protein
MRQEKETYGVAVAEMPTAERRVSEQRFPTLNELLAKNAALAFGHTASLQSNTMN